jgi:RNA polymerase sigma-70 factor (ECF subfamily)
MDAHDEFLTLFLKHQGDLRAFIGSMIRERSARDDVLQETALVLWREFDRYDRSRSFGAWARGFAANKVLQRLERETRSPISLPPEALPAILAAYERTEGPEEERREALDKCLQELPEKSRTLLTLRYEHGLSLVQLGERVHSTMDAAHKALSRIRTRLQACVERRLRLAEER